MRGPYWMTYWTMTTLVSFVAMVGIPTRKNPFFNDSFNRIDNIGGSLVAAACFGWLIWPLAIAAAFKSRRMR